MSLSKRKGLLIRNDENTPLQSPESDEEPATGGSFLSSTLKKWGIGIFIGLYILQCFAVIALLAWLGYITFLVNGIKQPIQFQLTSAEVGMDDALVYGINSDRPLYFVQCTNLSGTYNELQIKNHKKYAAGILCEIPANTCLESVCNADLRCQERLKTTSTCAQDSDCFTDPLYGSGYRCSLSNCSCVAAHVSAACTNDTSCPQDPLNPCASFVCNTTSGQCVKEYLDGSTCSSDEQCAAANGGDTNWFCNTTGGAPCGCIYSPPVVMNNTVCTIDANCPQKPGDTCGAFLCNMTAEACIYELNNGSQCSTNEDCSRINDSFDWFCNQTSCQCELSSTPSVNSSLPRWIRVYTDQFAQYSPSTNNTVPFNFSQQSSTTASLFTLVSSSITVLKTGWYEIAMDARTANGGGGVSSFARLRYTPVLDGVFNTESSFFVDPVSDIDIYGAHTATISITSGQVLTVNAECTTDNLCKFYSFNMFLMEIDGT